MEADFSVCLLVGLLIMRVAEAGPTTGEMGSPFGEDAAGYKGLNEGGFIDCPPLDSVISLQLVINSLALEPLAARTAGMALRAPSLPWLGSAAPSPRAAPPPGLIPTHTALLLSLGFSSFLAL